MNIYSNSLAGFGAADGGGTGQNVDPKKLEKVATGIGKVIEKVGSFLKKIFPGGFSDRPLVRTRDEIVELFRTNGYSTVDVNGKSIMEKYGLKQAQIDDKSKSVDYYANKFAKLYEYVIAVLSDNGRADLVAQFIANTPLYVPGGTKSITFLSQLLSGNKPTGLVNPPGGQIPLIPEGAIKPPSSVASDSGQSYSLPTEQVSNAYNVIKDAAGNITQIYDSAGRLLNPGTAEYQAAVNAQPSQAGTGWILGLVAVGLGALAWVAGRGGNNSRKK